MAEFTAGLRLNPNSIIRRQVKDGVTIKYGLAVSLDDNDQALLPAGDDDTRAVGCSVTQEDIVGDDDDPQFVDISTGSEGAPFISKSGIGAGKTFATKGTDGKVAASTTAGALLGRALNTTSGDDQRVWGNQNK